MHNMVKAINLHHYTGYNLPKNENVSNSVVITSMFLKLELKAIVVIMAVCLTFL